MREHSIRQKDRTPEGWPASCTRNSVHAINAAQRLALLKVYRTSRYWAHCGDWRDRVDALLREAADRGPPTRKRGSEPCAAQRKRRKGDESRWSAATEFVDGTRVPC